jgi:hypothetical protein
MTLRTAVLALFLCVGSAAASSGGSASVAIADEVPKGLHWMFQHYDSLLARVFPLAISDDDLGAEGVSWRGTVRVVAAGEEPETLVRIVRSDAGTVTAQVVQMADTSLREAVLKVIANGTAENEDAVIEALPLRDFRVDGKRCEALRSLVDRIENTRIRLQPYPGAYLHARDVEILVESWGGYRLQWKYPAVQGGETNDEAFANELAALAEAIARCPRSE